MKKFFTVLVSAALLFTPIPVLAMQGGEETIGNPDVVALLTDQSSVRPVCSAALVTSMIVSTAAHCVTKLNSELGELSRPASEFWISSAGEDLSSGKIGTRYQVSKIFRSEGYVNTWNPSSGDTRTQKDDIAFLVLLSPVEGRTTIPLIDRDELLRIKAEAMTITHIGYGLSEFRYIDGKPRTLQLSANSRGSSRYSSSAAFESHTITTNETGTKAICPGDSGSPWYVTIDGIKKLAAVTVGGSGCGGSGVNGALGTSVSEYGEMYKLAESAANSNLKKISQTKMLQSSKAYKSCKYLNKALPGGIAKTVKIASAKSLKNRAFVNKAGYLKNFKLDLDKDGIACEK